MDFILALISISTTKCAMLSKDSKKVVTGLTGRWATMLSHSTFLLGRLSV